MKLKTNLKVGIKVCPYRNCAGAEEAPPTTSPPAKQRLRRHSSPFPPDRDMPAITGNSPGGKGSRRNPRSNRSHPKKRQRFALQLFKNKIKQAIAPLRRRNSA